jgi:hypothetical protein
MNEAIVIPGKLAREALKQLANHLMRKCAQDDEGVEDAFDALPPILKTMAIDVTKQELATIIEKQEVAYTGSQEELTKALTELGCVDIYLPRVRETGDEGELADDAIVGSIVPVAAGPGAPIT